MQRLTAAEYRERFGRDRPGEKPAKYRNKKTYIGELKFDSKHEAKIYSGLALREKAGEIYDLQLQPKFPLVVNGKKVATYVGDFRYLDAAGRVHIVDAKSAITRKNSTYRLKRKLFEALHPGLVIEEV